ncbi:hypothetical protein NMY22_g14125 [Coprinellus aureogranulatus]|nr:hypothetical protein NMY22_g14125 [Coprinellus aureogranulatus]
MLPSKVDRLAGKTPGHNVDDLYYSSKLYVTAPANAVLKAGRELSSWILNTVPSPLPLSLFSTQGSAPLLPTPYINTLPQEVIEEIFREYLHGPTASYYCPDDPLSGSLSRICTHHTANTTPFTLAHVCASWRAIVMGNPTLWSKLCASRAQSQDIPLFQFWLSLSGGAPLDFALWQRYKNEREDSEEDIDTVAHTILLLALEHSDRWKSVSLGLTPDMEPLLTAGKPFPMSSLQSIDLEIWRWSPEGLQLFATTLSASAMLQDVSLGSIGQSSPFTTKLPWANMRRVELDEINITDLLSILRPANSLEDLHVNRVQGVRPPPLRPEDSSPIRLPSLVTLFIHYCHNPPTLLDMLSLPSLSSLSIGSGFDKVPGTGSGWKSFYDLAQRSGPGCRIRSLHWRDSDLPEEALIRNLKKGSNAVFADLDHLEIRTDVGFEFIDALTVRPEMANPLFPHLKWLELRVCRVDGS